MIYSSLIPSTGGNIIAPHSILIPTLCTLLFSDDGFDTLFFRLGFYSIFTLFIRQAQTIVGRDGAR